MRIRLNRLIDQILGVKISFNLLLFYHNSWIYPLFALNLVIHTKPPSFWMILIIYRTAQNLISIMPVCLPSLTQTFWLHSHICMRMPIFIKSVIYTSWFIYILALHIGRLTNFWRKYEWFGRLQASNCYGGTAVPLCRSCSLH